jgi:hypothetical protein
LTAENAAFRSDLLIPKRYAERSQVPETRAVHWTKASLEFERFLISFGSFDNDKQEAPASEPFPEFRSHSFLETA